MDFPKLIQSITAFVTVPNQFFRLNFHDTLQFIAHLDLTFTNFIFLHLKLFWLSDKLHLIDKGILQPHVDSCTPVQLGLFSFYELICQCLDDCCRILHGQTRFFYATKACILSGFVRGEVRIKFLGQAFGCNSHFMMLSTCLERNLSLAFFLVFILEHHSQFGLRISNTLKQCISSLAFFFEHSLSEDAPVD